MSFQVLRVVVVVGSCVGVFALGVAYAAGLWRSPLLMALQTVLLVVAAAGSIGAWRDGRRGRR